MRLAHLIAAAAVLVPAVAGAAETITYSYDARGRLIRVVRIGGPKNGAVTNYSHDQADNRVTQQTTGAP